MNQRFGKSMIMREMAKRFPGKVVHVTPENLPKRQRDPMFGITLMDTAHRRSGKTGMVAIATAPTPEIRELMKAIFQPEQDDES